MKWMLNAILQQYGSSVTLVFSDRETTVRAFLRPVPSKSLQNQRRGMDALGWIPGGQYLLIGPAGCGLEGAELVRCNGLSYLPRRTETLLLGDEPCYVWGLLTRGGEADGGTA